MTAASTSPPSPGANATGQASPRALRWVVLVVAGVAAAIYVEAIGHDFQNWDDTTVLLERSRVHALTWSNIKSIWTEPDHGDYFPLTEMSYALEYALRGRTPIIFHLTNIFLHAGCTALVCWLAFRLGLAGEGVFVAGLVFALHPIHVETVAWVSERKDLLAALFSLSALIAATDSRHPRRPYVWATVWGLAAMLSKPSAVSIGLVLLVLDVWHKKAKPRTALLRVLPLLMAGAALTVLVVHMHRSLDNINGTFWENPSRTVLLIAYGISFYLWKFINPNPLIPLYAYPDSVGWQDPTFIAAVVVSALLLVLLIRYRHAKWMPLTIGMYLAGLLPTLRVLEVGHMVVADRYAYFPSVALCIGVAAAYVWGRSHISSSSRLIRYRCVAGLVLAILAVLTFLQNRVWRNPETLWRYTVAANPQSPLAHLNLGDAFYHTDRYEQAEREFRIAVELDPDDDAALPNLGHALAAQGKADEAIEVYKETLRRFPNRPRVHYFLAGILAARDRHAEAERHYRRAIEMEPNFVEALAGYAKWFHAQHRPAAAADVLRRAVAIDPDHPAVLAAVRDISGPENPATRQTSPSPTPQP